MLKQENKIFKNLYNDYGWEVKMQFKRDDWKIPKELFQKGGIGL